jgi:hypothetical protein
LDQNDLPVTATVYLRDILISGKRPALMVSANKEDFPPPEGVEISFAEDPPPYGINRILWWRGTLIETRRKLNATSIGGPVTAPALLAGHQCFFDCNEVSAIWNHGGSYGGYVEISALTPGNTSFGLNW